MVLVWGPESRDLDLVLITSLLYCLLGKDLSTLLVVSVIIVLIFKMSLVVCGCELVFVGFLQSLVLAKLNLRPSPHRHSCCFLFFFFSLRDFFDNENNIYLRWTIWCFEIHIHCEMVNIIMVIKIPITSHGYSFILLWWKHLKSTLKANFKCIIHHINYNALLSLRFLRTYS